MVTWIKFTSSQEKRGPFDSAEKAHEYAMRLGYSMGRNEYELHASKTTPEARAKRRAARWRKTGVSERTVRWMRETGNL